MIQKFFYPVINYSGFCPSYIHRPCCSNKMESILSAHEIGEGLPVLIIHGWKMEARVEELDFEPIFSTIPGLRRIYVDLPGMGTTQ